MYDYKWLGLQYNLQMITHMITYDYIWLYMINIYD